MNNIRILQFALWSAVLIIGGLLAWSTYQWQVARQSGQTLTKLGGPFELVSNRGDIVTDQIVNKRPHLLMFGFTHCPDVCPTTLFEAAGWLKRLGNDAEKLDIYFVTVDPERDSKEVLNEYIGAFDARITGLTGGVDALHRMLKSYAVFFEKVPDKQDPEEYAMNHSATVYLMDKGGNFFGTIAYGEDVGTAIAKIRRLLKLS